MGNPIFVPNNDWEEEWLASDEALELVAQAAERVKEAAQEIAPVRLQHYRDSLDTEAAVTDGVATGRVYSDDFKAGWIEFGTGQPAPTPAFSPLAKAAEQEIGMVGG